MPENKTKFEGNAYGLNPTGAIANKWIGYVPFKTILGDAYPNLELQLVQFYLPDIKISTVKTGFQGYTIRLPGPQILNPDDKILKFQYMIDDGWINYNAFYTWASKLAVLTPTADSSILEKAHADGTLNFGTIRIWLLNAYKQRVVNFNFFNCFLIGFGDILLDCADTNPIKQTVTLSYSHQTIDINQKLNDKLIRESGNPPEFVSSEQPQGL